MKCGIAGVLNKTHHVYGALHLVINENYKDAFCEIYHDLITRSVLPVDDPAYLPNLEEFEQAEYHKLCDIDLTSGVITTDKQVLGLFTNLIEARQSLIDDTKGVDVDEN